MDIKCPKPPKDSDLKVKKIYKYHSNKSMQLHFKHLGKKLLPLYNIQSLVLLVVITHTPIFKSPRNDFRSFAFVFCHSSASCTFITYNVLSVCQNTLQTDMQIKSINIIAKLSSTSVNTLK